MGKTVTLKRMRLLVTVRLYEKTWDRVISDESNNVIWKDLDRVISENESTIQGLVEWVDQMKSIPHWNIVETDIKIWDYKGETVPEEDLILEDSEQEALENAGVVLDEEQALTFFDDPEELEEEDVLLDPYEEDELDELDQDEEEDEDEEDDADPAELLMELLSQLQKKKKSKKKKSKKKR